MTMGNDMSSWLLETSSADEPSKFSSYVHSNVIDLLSLIIPASNI